jgi:hypothetical protein
MDKPIEKYRAPFQQMTGQSSSTVGDAARRLQNLKQLKLDAP